MTQNDVIPRLGLGTFRLKDDVVIESVSSALDLGYRHIDTAAIYDNENAVGMALAQSELARNQYFLTTKVWHDQLRADQVVDSIKSSLERLQTDYLDMVLIHWPSPKGEVPIAETLAGLNEARKQGLTIHIGLSNFTIDQVSEARAAPGGEHLVTNQIEVHPFLSNRALVHHCQQHGLQVTAYMPLAVGNVMKDPTLKQIAERHHVTPAQVSLAWLLARDLVIIPSSTRRAHQEANMKAFDVALSADELAAIDALDRGERHANPSFAPNWDA